LNVTIAVSGYVRNRHINQRVYFSFIHNRSGGINQSATRTAIDDAIRVLAGADVPIFNLPPAPEFHTLRAAGNPPNLLLQWSAVPGATGYRIYRSINGGAFSFLRQVSGSTLLALEPTLDTALYAYRVSTVNGDGEGPGSNALVARINAPGPLVLLTRGSMETEPDPTQPIPAAMQALANAFDTDIRIEMAPATRVGGGQVDLTRFDAVVWYFDHDKPSTHTLSTQERTVVTNFLAGGGSLMISGSKLATSMDSDFGGTTATDAFLNDVLCHRAQSLSAGVTFVNSFQSVLFEGISATTLGDCNLAGFPLDVIEPVGAARRELLFQPGALGGAAISTDVGSRLVVFPVPFDCIPSVERRALYMERIMSFLVPPPVVVPSDFLSIQ
jgi:hypothetical protein